MIILRDVVLPTTDIRLQCDVNCYVFRDSLGIGELYITENAITWKSKFSEMGFTLTYESIMIFAISRDHDSFASDCIYLTVDSNGADFSLEFGGETSDHDSEPTGSVIMRFVPSQDEKLEEIYHHLSVCQSMNASSENYLLGHDSDDDFYGNSGSCEEDREEEEGDEGLSAEGRANFERIMRNSRLNHFEGDGSDEMEQE